MPPIEGYVENARLMAVKATELDATCDGSPATNAEAAAETAEFAAAHGRFWEMHDAIYDNQDQLGLPLLFALAGALGLPEADLRDALAAGKYAPKVRADFLGGVRSGVNGTPTFFINGERHNGTFEFDDLVAAIELRLHARAALSPRGVPSCEPAEATVPKCLGLASGTVVVTTREPAAATGQSARL